MRVSDLVRRVLDDLGEANHGHRVLHGHVTVVDLLQEVDHLLDAPELRVVVLDVPGREILDALYLDLLTARKIFSRGECW